MSELGPLLLFCLFVLLSAGFAGAESAITATDALKLQALIEEEGEVPIYRLFQTQRTRFIAALLVGNNIVNIGSAAIATSLFIHLLGDRLGPLAATAFTTVLVLTFGEILPKTVAISNPLPIFKAIVRPVHWLAQVLGPIVIVFEWLIQFIMQRLMVSTDRSFGSVRDLALLVDILGREGQLDWQKRRLFRGVLDLDRLKTRDVIVPRVKMETISKDSSLQDVIDLCLASGYSRIPVQEESKDEIVGIIHLKQALRYRAERGNICVTEAMQPPYFVPDSQKVAPLLKTMLRSRQHIAIVVDEFGGTLGLLTLEDLLEELVGEIYDESDLSPLARLQSIRRQNT
ncbi:MAG: hemolysin family protein [Cyanobacteria bacterium J06642_2]